MSPVAVFIMGVLLYVHLSYLNIIYCPGGCLLFAFCEICKIMGSLENISHLVHQINIQVFFKQYIPIPAHFSIPWLESKSYRGLCNDLNIIRQAVVYLIYANLLLALKADDIAQCMNSCICSAGDSESGIL